MGEKNYFPQLHICINSKTVIVTSTSKQAIVCFLFEPLYPTIGASIKYRLSITPNNKIFPSIKLGHTCYM